MKRTLKLLIGAFVLSASAPGGAQAASDFYLSSEIGVHFAKGPEAGKCIRTTAPASATSSSIPSTRRFTTVAGVREHQLHRAESRRRQRFVQRLRFRNRHPGRRRVGLSVAAPTSGSSSNTSTARHALMKPATCPATCRRAPAIVNVDKLRDEIRSATDRIGTLDAHNLFANVYYDFAGTARITPYLQAWASVSASPTSTTPAIG